MEPVDHIGQDEVVQDPEGAGLPRRPVPATDRSATYRQVFATREFRYLFLSHGVSMLGDQALRVGLALYVYRDTRSPLLTAFAYSLTFLPWVVAGPLLTGFADRLPRRTVLTIGNLARTVVIGLLILPGLPLAVILALVFVAEMMSPPIDAASFAVLPEILTDDSYVLGVAVNQTVSQGAQIIGFGLGGAAVASIGSRGAFTIDAASFLLAALLIGCGFRQPYPPGQPEAKRSFWADTREGLDVALGRRPSRSLLMLAWWGAAVLLVPEALAAPFVARVAHHGDTATGWLLAAQPAGMIIGMLVVSRLIRPARRPRLIHPLAIASTVPLIGFAFRPSLGVAMVLLVLSGMAWSYQVPLQGAFVELIPAAVRGRAFGVAAAGIQISQGAGVLLGGLLAELFGVTPALATAGIAGVIGMLALTATRAPRPVAAAAAT